MLAAKAFGNAASIRKSTNEVAEQILKAAGVGQETVRALELLSLFQHLEPDTQPEGFDDRLVHMKGELAYEHLVLAAEQHLVERSHGRMTAQPLPIANYLALNLGFRGTQLKRCHSVSGPASIVLEGLNE